MVNSIGRKPVHPRYFHLQVTNGAFLHILKFEILGVFRSIITHRANQARAPVALQGKHGQEVRIIQINVQFTVHRGTGAFNICNIEQVIVGATWKAHVEHLPRRGARTIAAGKIGK